MEPRPLQVRRPAWSRRRRRAPPRQHLKRWLPPQCLSPAEAAEACCCRAAPWTRPPPTCSSAAAAVSPTPTLASSTASTLCARGASGPPSTPPRDMWRAHSAGEEQQEEFFSPRLHQSLLEISIAGVGRSSAKTAPFRQRTSWCLSSSRPPTWTSPSAPTVTATRRAQSSFATHVVCGWQKHLVFCCRPVVELPFATRENY